MSTPAIGTPLIEAIGNGFTNVQAGQNDGQTPKTMSAIGYHVTTMSGGSSVGLPKTNTPMPGAAPSLNV